MSHYLGIIFSILGIILSSAGIIGEERLKSLETHLRNVNALPYLSRIMRSKPVSYSFFIGSALVIGTCLSIFWVTSLPQSSIIRVIVEDVFWVGLGLLGVSLAGMVLYYILLALLLFFGLPYRVLDNIVQRAKLQSTFVLIGIILGIAGVLLLEIN